MKPLKKEMEWWEKEIWTMLGRFDSSTGMCIGTVQIESPEFVVWLFKRLLKKEISKAKAEAYQEALNDYKTKTWPDINQKLKVLEVNKLMNTTYKKGPPEATKEILTVSKYNFDLGKQSEREKIKEWAKKNKQYKTDLKFENNQVYNSGYNVALDDLIRFLK